MGQTLWVQPLQRFIDSLNEELFHIGDWKFSILGVIKLVVLPLLAVLAARYMRKGLRFLLRRSENLDTGVKSAILAVAYYLTLTLGLVVAMDQIGVDVTSLAVFTGAVGVGIGLGLQDFARNFIAGILMMGTRPVKPGDRIEFSGLSGVVRSIGPYSTILETVDNAGLLVPNSILLNDRVVNRSFFQSQPMVGLTVRLPHTADLDDVMAKLRQQYSGKDGYDAQVTAVTETAVEVRVTIPLEGSALADVTDKAYRRVIAALAKPAVTPES